MSCAAVPRIRLIPRWEAGRPDDANGPIANGLMGYDRVPKSGIVQTNYGKDRITRFQADRIAIVTAATSKHSLDTFLGLAGGIEPSRRHLGVVQPKGVVLGRIPAAPTFHPGFLAAPSRRVSSPVKIAIIAHLKFPIAQPFSGGLEMHTHFLASALRARGHSVTLYASEGSQADLGLVAVCPPTGTAFDAASALAIDRLEGQAYETIMDAVARGGFDIVHNNSLHPLPLLRAPEIGAPMVTALHTPPFEPFCEGVRARAYDMTFAAVSDSLAAEWCDVIPRPLLIGNGIDLDAFAFNPRPKDPPHAIWTGRLVPEKGPHLAIDAARAAGLPLVFAGPRSDPAYWDSMIAPRLGPDVTYLGHLSHADLARRVGEAHVTLCSPRWEEPFGLVVAESLACGTPVAAFGRGAIPDILDGSCGVLAKADDVADLGRAVAEAIGLERQACRRRAEQLFDANIMTDRYEALYAEEIRLAAPSPLRAHLLDEA